MGVLPDKERLIDGAKRVDFELVVAIITPNKKLDVVVEPDETVTLGHGGRHKGLFDPVPHIEVGIVVQTRHPCVVVGRLATDHIYKTR
jgi:hypothetical protein